MYTTTNCDTNSVGTGGTVLAYIGNILDKKSILLIQFLLCF